MSGRQQHIRGKHDAVTVHTVPKHVFMLFILIFILLGWKHRENFKLYYQTHFPQWAMEQQMQHMQNQQFPGMMPGYMPPPNMGGMPGHVDPQMHQMSMHPPAFMPPPNGLPGAVPGQPPVFRPPPSMAPPPSFNQ